MPYQSLKSQIACSRSGNKAHGAASIHIGIATGSVNKITGTSNNAAQMQKITASTITGTNNTNNNSNNTSISRSIRYAVQGLQFRSTPLHQFDSQFPNSHIEEIVINCGSPFEAGAPEICSGLTQPPWSISIV
jgi:hypothetical protein